MSAPPVTDDASLALDTTRAVPDGWRGTVRDARRAGRTRRVVVGALLATLTVATALWSITLGSYPVALDGIIPALRGDAPDQLIYIVRDMRVPRTLTAVLVGAGFGVSGAIFQTLARNPLASPDIIGITAGASFGAVLVLTGTLPFVRLVPLGALLGAVAVSFAIYVLSYRRGVSAYRLILVGIGIQAVLGSSIEVLLLRASDEQEQMAVTWLVGSLNARGWQHVVAMLVVLAVLLPATTALRRPAGGLQLGEGIAAGLGVRVTTSRAGLLLIGSALAAGAVAAAGPITFVAFVSPPIARRLVASPGPAFVASALVGSALVVTSDAAGRALFDEFVLPVGIVTGLVGAPYLVFLLSRANQVGRSG